MTSPIQEIKDKLDVVEFIRSYIPLTPAGKNFKALCPFHKEKTASFMVSPERQSWHCFGACNEGGDIFKFLMKHENLEFYEALKILAEKAGVELKKISPADQKQFGVLYDINESAKNFFRKKLGESDEVLNYLKDRGLKEETIEEFELGLATNQFDELIRYLINSGYDVKDVERAGLSFKTERGSYIDRFRDRIMFPLYNHFGKVIGFSGRILPQLESQKPEFGKYVNSPETLIFNKSRILYGFHKSKKHILEKKAAVLVEGQMDFLMAYQDGVKNAVATSGTALTFDHLKTIRRLTDQLIFFFDNDEAGLKAAERSIDLAAAGDFNVRLLTMKEYKDPAEAVKKKPGFIAETLKEAVPAIEFYFNRYLKQVSSLKPARPAGGSQISNLDIGEFKKNIRIVLGKIKNLASAVEKNHWLKQLSLRTKIEEKALAEEMEQLKTQINVNRAISPDKRGYISFNQLNNNQREPVCSRHELICQRLLSLAILDKDFQGKINDYLDYFLDDYSLILKCLNEQTKLEDERLNNLLNLISLRSSFEAEILDEEKRNAEFNELLRQLRLECLKEKRNKLIHSIKEAEQNGDETGLVSVLKDFNDISKMMVELK